MSALSTSFGWPTDRRRFLKAAGALAAAASVAGPARAATSARRHPHKYEELLPEEFYEEQKRAPIVYLPIGAPEEHGLQSVLAVDPWTAYEACLRAVERSGGVVYPVIPFAPAGHPAWSREELRKRKKDAAPPSCFVSRELCKSLYIELMESLAELDFKACVAFSGHFPGDVLLQEIDKELGGAIHGMRFWGGGTVSLLRNAMDELVKQQPLVGGHGMMWETSIVMALHENWVDLSRVDRIKDSPISHQLKDQTPERIQAIKTANAALGNRFLNLAGERMAKLAADLLKRPSGPRQAAS
jgi:creatinine amidohydrolase/Fe(II)-dependent formamide hydrolase-like protein